MKPETDTTDLSTDKAIETVLAAEQQAREQLDECRHEAEQLIKQARLRAARILQRADHRITQTHIHCTLQTNAELDGMKRSHHEALTERIARIQPDDAVLEQAARRLAMELIMPSKPDSKS